MKGWEKHVLHNATLLKSSTYRKAGEQVPRNYNSTHLATVKGIKVLFNLPLLINVFLPFLPIPVPLLCGYSWRGTGGWTEPAVLQEGAQHPPEQDRTSGTTVTVKCSEGWAWGRTWLIIPGHAHQQWFQSVKNTWFFLQRWRTDGEQFSGDIRVHSEPIRKVKATDFRSNAPSDNTVVRPWQFPAGEMCGGRLSWW